MQLSDDTRGAAFEVLQPGSFTTVQDLGRPGYARFGVPDGGAMDKYALQAANMLVGNGPGAAGLEVTNAGLALRVLTPMVVAVAGADLGLQVNGLPAPMWTVLSIDVDDVIHFSTRRLGVRAYLAVAGGVDVPAVMGSRSTYVPARIGGFDGRALRKGDRLSVGTETDSLGAAAARERAGLSLPENLRRFGLPLPVRVVAGPQAEAFAPIAFHRLAGSPYVVTEQADRMGYRLHGIALPYAEDVGFSRARPLTADGQAEVRTPADGQAGARPLTADGQAGAPTTADPSTAERATSRSPVAAGPAVDGQAASRMATHGQAEARTTADPSTAERSTAERAADGSPVSDGLVVHRPTAESPAHVSDGVAPGSIQVPGDGQPILLLADRQTVGGYPKIATVISVDLDFLAHVWPGEPVRFRFVDLETAQRLRGLRREMLEEVRRFAVGG